MSVNLITIENMSLRLDSKLILDRLSLEIVEGEYLAIIGPNGAGKTTLLKCLMRIHAGAAGRICLRGMPLKMFSQKELAKHISYVPQGIGRTLPFTVWEYVLMGRYPYLTLFSSAGAEDKRAAEIALAVTKTSPLRDRTLETLSGGEAQMVFIAAALAQGSRIMLLDEPTAFLDPKHVSEVHSLLREINRTHHITIVAVTHDVNGALLNADRIAVLKEGAVFFAGTSSGIIESGILERAYGKKFLLMNHPVTNQKIIAPEVYD